METQENRKEMVNPICFIMIGLPGSGKSTIAESYAKKFNAGILSTDKFIEYQAELIEGNNWKDTYWGVCHGKGQNNLGKLLMRIREENRRFLI